MQLFVVLFITSLEEDSSSHHAITPYEKLEEILEDLYKKKHCTVVIDLGIMQFATNEEQKPLDDLIYLCNLVQNSKVCSVVISLSSGAGTSLSFGP